MGIQQGSASGSSGKDQILRMEEKLGQVERYEICSALFSTLTEAQRKKLCEEFKKKNKSPRALQSTSEEDIKRRVEERMKKNENVGSEEKRSGYYKSF